MSGSKGWNLNESCRGGEDRLEQGVNGRGKPYAVFIGFQVSGLHSSLL